MSRTVGTNFVERWMPTSQKNSAEIANVLRFQH